jgi:hypothetical protein
MRNPGVAAVLSAIIPGVGQFYNGRFLAGILWLIITPGLWIGTGGLDECCVVCKVKRGPSEFPVQRSFRWPNPRLPHAWPFWKKP